MANVRSLGTVGFGFSALLCAFAVASCGGAQGDDNGSDTGGSGGSGATGGATTGGATTGGATTGGATTGGATTGGASGSSTGGTAGDTGTGGTAGMEECTPHPPAQTCSGATPNMHDPADGVLIKWSTYNTSTKNWGDMAVGDLTGGTSVYPAADSIVPALETDRLRITVTLPPYSAEAGAPANYAGLVFWFGPCINASAYGGVSFSVGGTMGGAALKLQVQTAQNYPSDPANAKGACDFADCDTKWSECKGPDTTVTVPEANEDVTLDWASFTGGTPNAEVDPTGLVGLQFQVECPAETECAVDITLGNVTLTPL